MNKNIALIIAGGSGNRMHGDIPKQFVEVDGVPIIVYTLKVFEIHPEITEIVVICIKEWINELENMAERYGITKLTHIFAGGKTSHESISNGANGLKDKGYDSDDVILVHDAVRPLISARIISDNISAAREKGNAVTAIRGYESYLYSEDGKSSSKYYSRDNMYRVQTPHTFRLGDMLDAFDEAGRKSIVSQSMYVLMAELNRYPINLVEGDKLNFKITYPEDCELLKLYHKFHEK